jgi:nicotinamidase-related amidase
MMDRHSLGIAAAALVLLGGAAARADIIDDWASVKTPPPPELKQVSVDPKTTALLMIDFLKANCGVRPRCGASLPTAKKLLGEARAAKAPVLYTFFGNFSVADMIDPELAPKGDEPSVKSGPDKFINTNLDDLLKQKGVKTVIVIGTAANGAVLITGSEAALRGYDVIVPVDGISDSDTYKEQYTVFQLANAPTYGPRVTLTRVNMMKF